METKTRLERGQSQDSGTHLDYSSSEFEAGENCQGPSNSSYKVASDDRVLRITMPAEGFVTVVPVDKMGSRKTPTTPSKEPRGVRAGDWGLRDPSPSTARLRSKSSRRDESPYCVKSIVPPCEPSATDSSSKRNNPRKTHSSPAPVKLQAKTKQSKSSPSGGKVANKNSDVANNKGSTRNSASTTATMTSSAGGTLKRESSPSSSRRTNVNKPESNQTTNNQKPKVERSNSKRVIQRSNSGRDTERVSRVTVRRVPSIRDPSPARSKAPVESRAKDSSVVTVKRTGSRREASPRTRLGVRNSTPNTSNASLKGQVGRSDSLRHNKSNPPSRSSSFNRNDTKSSGGGVRAGLATLPRDLASRSRSQGDYVTVLEIGGMETRSKSATSRPSRDTSSTFRRAQENSRSGSVSRVTENSGTVSVHIKQNSGQALAGSHITDSRPARKQSIKIGRENSTPQVSRLDPAALKSHSEPVDDSSSSGTYGASKGASQATVGRETADSSGFPATTRDIAVQCLEAEAECEFTEEELTIVRRPGEKLGFGLRFEGGGRASETVRRLYIQCCSPQSPAARAACSWGGIVEGDQILAIAGQHVHRLTRLQCVKALKDSPVSVNMRIRHYFTHQLGQASSYDLHPISDKKISNLNKQTKEKTSQTSPKKPVRTSNKKAVDEVLSKPRGSRLLSSQSLRVSSSVPSLGLAKGSVETETKANEHGRSSSVSLTNKKCVRGSPKASSARELIEKKKDVSKEEKAATLPRKGTIYAKRESCNSGGRRVSTLPRDTEDSGSLESVGDITADTSMDYEEFSSQTLPRSYKADVIKSEWQELAELSTAALDSEMFHTLPKAYSKLRSEAECEEGMIQPVLTVQEKLQSLDSPPPAELYVNLLEDEEDLQVQESDVETASLSTISHRPTPHITPHHSFSGADRTKPIDIAKMLDPFEQLEREFGWEGGLTIRPPSAFCSLADIQEDSDETVSDKVRGLAQATSQDLDDSGVCDVEELAENRQVSEDVRRGRQCLQNMQPGSYLTLDRRNPRKSRDGHSMDGLIVLHQHQGSYDSTDSGSLPPTYSRLPPDGHEFPEDYVDPSLCTSLADNQLEFLSRKSSASSTASLDRHSSRTKASAADDKLSGVRAKIALFSSETQRSSSTGASKQVLGKYQSSEDVGKMTLGSSLTRAHTHSDVRFDETGAKRQTSSHHSLKTEARKVKENSASSNLKPHNKSTSFRSMINVSSSQNSSSEDKVLSRTDLTKSTDVLLRTQKKDQIIWEEAVVNNDKIMKTVPTISTRSQSLNEIGKVRQQKTVQGKSRSTTMIVPATEQPSTRKSSMTNLIEQRRRSTMTKLKGLVIPEILTESNSTNHNSSKEKTLPAGKPSSGSYSNKISGSALPNPPWKDKNTSEDFPKYSPAFKRKPFTVYNTGSNNAKKDDGEQSSRSHSQPASKPPIGKKNSDESSNGIKTEDSDNDSAVSSGRSSLSCRSCTPPTSPKAGRQEKAGSTKNITDINPRLLKKNSVEAINRQNVLNACKKSSANSIKASEATEPPLETSSPRNNRACGRPASRSSSFTIAERKKSFESHHSESRRGSNSSHDSVSRKNSRDVPEKSSGKLEEFSSVRSSRVTTPTGNCHYPESIMDIEERVAFMTEVVDRAASVTPTERRSLSRTPSIASERSERSERSSYSSRSSRNSSIVSEKAPFARNNSIMSKDSAISEDISKEMEEKQGGCDKRWSDLEKKYSRGLSSSSIGETISKLAKSTEDSKTERPKDLMISQKKITNGINSPSSKNFKELAEKWQTLSVPECGTASSSVSTLPRKSSRDKSREEPSRGSELATLPRRASRESPVEPAESQSWCSPPAIKGSYYQVSGETEWSGFDMSTGGKGEVLDRKYSVPAFNESAVKLRDKKDNVPSRPSSLIESSEKDLKIFEIGNLGDNNRLLLGSASTSQSSSQADLLDSHSVTSDTPKSPLPSSSSREILDVFSNRNNRRAVSVNDIRRAFEKAEQSLSTSGTSGPKRSGLSTPSSHNRMSSLDSTTSSEESSIPTPHFHGSVSSLASGHGGDRLKDHYGSITSLASSTSMISPQELQNLIDEANQSLEESGTPSHEIMVIVLHREFSGGTIGITLAGGADYESKEITVHKVIAGSLADRDGRIQKGDRVLSINGRSTKGITHREALSILKAPRAEVVLVLSRSRSVTPADRSYDLIDAATYNFINSSRPPKILESPLDSKSLSADLKFVDVPRGPPITVTLKKEGAGLGFSLEGGKDSPYGDRPMTIKKIFTGGAADKNGILKVGDEILFVNNVDITRMTRLEAWNFMKKLNDGSQVVVVRQKLDPSAKTVSGGHRDIPIVKTELVGDTNPEEKTH